MSRVTGPLANNRGSKYTDEIRRQAIGVFFVTGNYKATAKQLGIPHKTVHEWRKKEWWIKELAYLRTEKSEELDAQTYNSMMKAQKSIDDRLDNGDPYIIVKTGQIAYKPVSCRDSVVAFGILYDKLALMRNMPTSIVAKQDLTKLQHTFEALVRPSEIVEGELIGG